MIIFHRLSSTRFLADIETFCLSHYGGKLTLTNTHKEKENIFCIVYICVFSFVFQFIFLEITYKSKLIQGRS